MLGSRRKEPSYFTEEGYAAYRKHLIALGHLTPREETGATLSPGRPYLDGERLLRLRQKYKKAGILK